jgi:hypothetical protein
MGKFSFCTLHPADEYIGYGAFFVEAIAKVSVDSLENFVLIIIPYCFKVIKLLQFHISHPGIESLGIGQLLIKIVFGLLVIEHILILGISEIPKNIFGIAGKLLEVE